jgi:hypothetical protein
VQPDRSARRATDLGTTFPSASFGVTVSVVLVTDISP